MTLATVSDRQTALTALLREIGIRKVWDPTKHPRGPSAPGHSPGEFAPTGGGSELGGEGRAYPYETSHSTHPSSSERRAVPADDPFAPVPKGTAYSAKINLASDQIAHLTLQLQTEKGNLKAMENARVSRNDPDYVDTLGTIASLQRQLETWKRDYSGHMARRLLEEGGGSPNDVQAVHQERAAQQQPARQQVQVTRRSEEEWRAQRNRERQSAWQDQEAPEEAATRREAMTQNTLKPGRWARSAGVLAGRIASSLAEAWNIARAIEQGASRRNLGDLANHMDDILVSSRMLRGHLERLPGEAADFGNQTRMKLESSRDAALRLKAQIRRLRRQRGQ